MTASMVCRIAYRLIDADVFLNAFDRLELNGADVRRRPLLNARPSRRRCSTTPKTPAGKPVAQKQ